MHPMIEEKREEWTRYLAYVEEKWGALRVASVEPRHVLVLRDSFADVAPPNAAKRGTRDGLHKNRPSAANNLLRAWRRAARTRKCRPSPARHARWLSTTRSR
jgi:hypothetical protein